MTHSLRDIPCDYDVFNIIEKEQTRQQHHIELIASENIVSPHVLKAQGSVFTNKYAEGYPSKRYYCGCIYADEVETLAIERAKLLFHAGFANVQPHSGAQANGAVFLALLKPGDVFMGMSLDCGGHLTHGAKVTISGKWFDPVSYAVDPSTHLIDYDDILLKAKKYRPKLIIAGGSSYSRIIDFKKFREICDEVGAYLMVDMAHFAGLVAAGVYPSPIPFADVVTTTTHKTLRGPRGGMILCNNPDIAKKINSAVFPGLQGGPLMHVIAAKAVAFFEALQPSFKDYAKDVVANCKEMERVFHAHDVPMVSGGTDSHLLMLDLRKFGVSGHDLSMYLDEVGVATNKNTIPFDPAPPMVSSGLRIGSACMTSRGFGINESQKVAELLLEAFALDEGKKEYLRSQVKSLCTQFPLPYTF